MGRQSEQRALSVLARFEGAVHSPSVEDDVPSCLTGISLYREDTDGDCRDHPDMPGISAASSVIGCVH